MSEYIYTQTYLLIFAIAMWVQYDHKVLNLSNKYLFFLFSIHDIKIANNEIYPEISGMEDKFLENILFLFTFSCFKAEIEVPSFSRNSSTHAKDGPIY